MNVSKSVRSVLFTVTGKKFYSKPYQHRKFPPKGFPNNGGIERTDFIDFADFFLIDDFVT